MYRDEILSSPTWKIMEKSGMAAIYKINLPSLLDSIRDVENCPEIGLAPYVMTEGYFKKEPFIAFSRKLFKEGNQLFSLPITFKMGENEKKLDVAIHVHREGDKLMIMYLSRETGNDWLPSATGLFVDGKRMVNMDFVSINPGIPQGEFIMGLSRLICNIITEIFSRESKNFFGTMDDLDEMAGHC